jgi:hypothetical protein
MIIKESFSLTVSNADILSAPSRLAAIPANGVLTLEMSAGASNVTNNYTVTLQLPDGSIPFEDLTVPYNGRAGTDRVLDSNMQLTFAFEATQGGHFLLSCTETGATELFIYATLTF